MKRTTLLFVISALMILITACGNSSSVLTSAPATELVPQVTDTAPAPQVTSSDLPAATSANVSTTVDIKLDDNVILSSQTDFKVGVKYTFVVTNQGGHAHNFNVAPPVSVAGSLDAAFSKALLVIGRDKLQSGKSVSVEYTFPESAADQKLEFSCLIPRHYDDGMYLAITVTK